MKIEDFNALKKGDKLTKDGGEFTITSKTKQRAVVKNRFGISFNMSSAEIKKMEVVK